MPHELQMMTIIIQGSCADAMTSTYYENIHGYASNGVTTVVR